MLLLGSAYHTWILWDQHLILSLNHPFATAFSNFASFQPGGQHLQLNQPQKKPEANASPALPMRLVALA